MGDSLYLALAVGTACSLLFTERFRILPAGLIVPGYLALLVERPLVGATVLALAMVTYVMVKYGLAPRMILYGRRKFVAMLLVGLVVTLPLEWWIEPVTGVIGIGVVVPGLIANTMERQGVRLTLMATGLLTMVTYLILQVLNVLFW